MGIDLVSLDDRLGDIYDEVSAEMEQMQRECASPTSEWCELYASLAAVQSHCLGAQAEADALLSRRRNGFSRM